MRSSIVCTHNARTQILPMALAIRARLWSATTDAHYGLSPHIISNLFRERRERASFWSFVCLPFAVYGWFLAFFGANPWTNWTKIVNGNQVNGVREKGHIHDCDAFDALVWVLWSDTINFIYLNLAQLCSCHEQCVFMHYDCSWESVDGRRQSTPSTPVQGFAQFVSSIRSARSHMFQLSLVAVLWLI